MLELPAGTKFVRGVELEGEPFAIFKAEEGTGAFAFKGGAWVPLESAGELIAVASEGRAVSDEAFADWISKLS